MGYGHKGKGVLIHLLIDQNGHPIAATNTSTGGDERKEVEVLLNKIPLK